MCEGIIVCLVL